MRATSFTRNRRTAQHHSTSSDAALGLSGGGQPTTSVAGGTHAIMESKQQRAADAAGGAAPAADSAAPAGGGGSEGKADSKRRAGDSGGGGGGSKTSGGGGAKTTGSAESAKPEAAAAAAAAAPARTRVSFPDPIPVSASLVIRGGGRAGADLDLEAQSVRVGGQTFNLDGILEASAPLVDVYRDAGFFPLVQTSFDGYDTCMVVYAQDDAAADAALLNTDGAEDGLLVQMFEHIFRQVKASSGGGRQFLVEISMLLVGPTEAYDLLGTKASKIGKPLQATVSELDSKAVVPEGATAETASSEDVLLETYQRGRTFREQLYEVCVYVRLKERHSVCVCVSAARVNRPCTKRVCHVCVRVLCSCVRARPHNVRTQSLCLGPGIATTQSPLPPTVLCPCLYFLLPCLADKPRAARHASASRDAAGHGVERSRGRPGRLPEGHFAPRGVPHQRHRAEPRARRTARRGGLHCYWPEPSQLRRVVLVQHAEGRPRWRHAHALLGAGPDGRNPQKRVRRVAWVRL